MEQDSKEITHILTERQNDIKRETARLLRRDMTASEKCLWQHLRASRQEDMRFYRQQLYR